MAFVAVVPAVGSAVAGIGGLASTGLASLGGLASSIPVVGSTIAPAFTGLGGAVGSLGAGVGGMLNGGGLGALGHGLSGAGHALKGGLGGIYGGADKLLGGMLPNMGGVGVTPAQGYMGNLIPGIKQMPMFGGVDPTQAVGYGTVLAPPAGGFPAAGGGMGGMLGKGLGALGKFGQAAGQINAARNIFDPPGATQPGVYDDRVIQRNNQDTQSSKPIIYGGGQTPTNQSVQLAPPSAYAPIPPITWENNGKLNIPFDHPDLHPDLQQVGKDILAEEEAKKSAQRASLDRITGGSASSMK